MAALRKKEKIKLSQKEKTKKINRFIIFSILTISISLLFPGGEQLDYNYEIGDITREEIVAEFNFPILKSEDQLQKELIEAKVKVPYEFQRNQNISIDQNKKIEIFFNDFKNLSNASNNYQKTLQLLWEKKYGDEENKIKTNAVTDSALFIDLKESFLKKYPFITAYNVVNFYKIQKLCDLSEKYDELLYLDFDVIPTNTNNFFESFDLKKGIAIENNFKDRELELDYNDLIYYHLKKSIKYKDIKKSEDSGKSNRSPESKYWNAMALNIEKCGVTRSSSYNTGIIGATSSDVKKLNYWEDFSELLDFMTELKDDEMWPEQLRRYFGWDNETIWGHRVELNSVDTQELGEHWHFRFWRDYHIPKTINFIHALNKDFDYIKKWLKENDKNNL